MRREFITAVPPWEVREIALASGASVSLEITEAEPFRGMPRFRVVVKGGEWEVKKFMMHMMRARAGG
ncbi:TIGR04140 family protein [Thermococcus sp.]|uniref:TIGR04140 family protein n=1 Tax=Thermococcus sp. TaxID=35749 RepID=UPI002604C437|nr:TIGR04140 family protein [Thermococcus sp.]